MDEAEQLHRLIAGDGEAWNGLVREHAGVLHAMVARVLSRGSATEAEIEDVVQAVFLKLWDDDRRRLKAFRGGARLGTWLVAIARREAIDRLRARERQGRHLKLLEDRERDTREAPPGPLAEAAQGESRAKVGEALASLAPRDRLLVTWIEQGWTYRAVARVLALRENSIGPLLARARDRLRRALAAPSPSEVYGSPGGTPPTGRLDRP